jgi:hypothetical protein
MGIKETEASITMKVNRGAFPTWFFFASMKTIGCPLIRLEDDSFMLANRGRIGHNS